MKMLTTRFMLMAVLTTGIAFFVTTVEPPEAEAQRRRKRRKKRKKRKKMQPLLGAKLGLIGLGSGTIQTTGGGATAEATYEEKSLYALNGFFLAPVSRQVLIGASLWFTPSFDPRAQNSTTIPTETGYATEVNGLAEFRQKFQGLDGFLYGEAGFMIITPPDPAQGEPARDNATGFNLGGGAGIQFAVSRQVVLRTDARFSFFTASSAFNNTEETINGTRLMINAGVAFGL